MVVVFFRKPSLYIINLFSDAVCKYFCIEITQILIYVGLMFRRKSGAVKMTTLSAVSLQKVFPYGRLNAKQKQVILFNANGTSNLNFSLDRPPLSSYCC